MDCGRGGEATRKAALLPSVTRKEYTRVGGKKGAYGGVRGNLPRFACLREIKEGGGK